MYENYSKRRWKHLMIFENMKFISILNIFCFINLKVKSNDKNELFYIHACLCWTIHYKTNHDFTVLQQIFSWKLFNLSFQLNNHYPWLLKIAFIFSLLQDPLNVRIWRRCLYNICVCSYYADILSSSLKVKLKCIFIN